MYFEFWNYFLHLLWHFYSLSEPKKKLKIIIKKKFTTNFHFFNRFTQAPTPLSKQPKSTKHDKRFLLRLPKFGKFMVLSLGCSSITFQFHGTNKWLYVTSYPWPWIKNLSVERDLSKGSLITVPSESKKLSFDQCFLYVYG